MPYSKVQKAQALILLASNRGNLSLTAAQTGISSYAIKRWANEAEKLPPPDIGLSMEQAIQYTISQIPSLLNKYNIAEILNTLLDKWLVYQGIPQQSVQMVLSVLETKPTEELDRMLEDIQQGHAIRLEDGRGQIIEVPTTSEDGSVLDLIEYKTKEPDDPKW